MNADNVIEKLQRITREKEAKRSEHKRRQEEATELLRRKVEKELKRTKRKNVLNI
jgi:hypothetical protein